MTAVPGLETKKRRYAQRIKIPQYMASRIPRIMKPITLGIAGGSGAGKVCHHQNIPSGFLPLASLTSALFSYYVSQLPVDNSGEIRFQSAGWREKCGIFDARPLLQRSIAQDARRARQNQFWPPRQPRNGSSSDTLERSQGRETGKLTNLRLCHALSNTCDFVRTSQKNNHRRRDFGFDSSRIVRWDGYQSLCGESILKLSFHLLKSQNTHLVNHRTRTVILERCDEFNAIWSNEGALWSPSWSSIKIPSNRCILSL